MFFCVDYKTKTGIKQRELYHGGFQHDPKPATYANIDILPQYRRYFKPNSLANRLKKGICELCGAETKEIHMHHIKKLKDLTGETTSEMLMLKKRRKSLALCRGCYEGVRAHQL